MLENEDVDDDYFTPIARTSLANIFKKPFSDDKSENETLKYTPPSPKSTQKQDEPKPKRPYDFIHSCVVNAYLWLDNVYTHKGRLGCAVVKLKTDESLNFHSIILYDSKKATVSTTIASKKLEVTVKEKSFISFYDNYQKYWCLYGSEDDIEKVIDILKTCDVNIKFSKESVNHLPDHSKPETDEFKIENTNTTSFESEQDKIERLDVKLAKSEKQIIGSDTDSSINRKTKASILNRMANMGQSVLPPRSASNVLTSYSSDSNESDNHIVALRPKPSIMKKNISEKSVLQQQSKSNLHKKSIAPKIQHSIENKTCAVVEDQIIMPLQSSSIITSTSGNDLSFFITEQRIANSELRINMTRMTDKVDNILNKLDHLETVDKKEGTAYINNEILHKLLKEYEGKIKTYEELLTKIDRNTNVTQKNTSTTDLAESKDREIINQELTALRNKIIELDNCIKQRDDDIYLLNREIEFLKASEKSQNSVQNKDELLTKVSELEQVLSAKDEMLAKLTAQNNELSKKSHEDQFESKIKVIMNDTFRAAASNFVSTETYSGEDIHHIIAAVIKKVTIESLQASK